MNKVVENAVKVDLHIHSAFSSHKDGDIVKHNTLENLYILVDKLNEYKINVCSITDHDLFNFDLYKKLKDEEGNGSIQKVLPGVEFSVEYEKNGMTAVIHVVTLFNDTDIDKVKNIENVINGEGYKPVYDLKDSFSEKRYLEILKEIDLDTVMIAHQKNTLSSKRPRKNDANSLGKEKFTEFLFTEYFEAYEFRNKDYEVFMNNYIVNEKVQDLLRMITGSDCHSWKNYPNIDAINNKEKNVFTWLKCLPTFKGVVMAMTDYRRIKKIPSFFNPNEIYIDRINLMIKDKLINIPLSMGINAIIGDNSIGKSLLLHELTKYMKEGKGLTRQIRESYKQHMIDNNYSIETEIPPNSIYIFDMQGEIRKNFEEHKLKGKSFMNRYFPENIDTSVYEAIIDNEVNKYCESIKRRKTYIDKLNIMTVLDLKEDIESSESMVLIDDLEQNLNIVTDYNSLNSDINLISTKIYELEKNKLLDAEDIKFLKDINILLRKISEKHVKKQNKIVKNNSVINVLKLVIGDKIEEITERISDTQKKKENFIKTKNSIINDIVNLVKLEKNTADYFVNIDRIDIIPKHNDVYNYSFITKIGIKEISNEYIQKLILSIFNSKGSLSAKELFNRDYEISNLIKNYPSGEIDVYKVIKEKVKTKYESDFKNINTINIGKEKDKFRELSQGFNTKIYFDIISFDKNTPGIYIVDQPEDNVSQKAIKDYVLDRFKIMSSNRQVILVTHNPQFIVNLDVDNVIYLGKNDDGLFVQSGALEYNEEYNILNIVADNIDGGIKTINKRWKRYEKNSNF